MKSPYAGVSKVMCQWIEVTGVVACGGSRSPLITRHPPISAALGAYDGDDSAGAGPVHTDRSTSFPELEASA
jgi:hypothetical protein